MEDDFDRKEAYKRAEKRVKEIKAFYIHLACYCIVTPLIIYINLEFSPHYYWFVYSVVGWGIGILMHALATFVINNKRWEERKIKELMEKEYERKTKYE
ncbi:hypothetical protein GCM10007424_27660 [Flavobacterium suaedae]|uniref:2TM domain-containing protein n=1 Tax=Flavobacterium suaedae TaxID=1767027 RepID=A0ABQ1K3J1_9FLAO|nr:2TM domain-containing protein [Flavobacterium suaedae]GGB86075.1 hypothetical protein GCM10007424_27660 [Flavobacterium suaedae]